MQALTAPRASTCPAGCLSPALVSPPRTSLSACYRLAIGQLSGRLLSPAGRRGGQSSPGDRPRWDRGASLSSGELLIQHTSPAVLRMRPRSAHVATVCTCGSDSAHGGASHAWFSHLPSPGLAERRLFDLSQRSSFRIFGVETRLLWLLAGLPPPIPRRPLSGVPGIVLGGPPRVSGFGSSSAQVGGADKSGRARRMPLSNPGRN